MLVVANLANTEWLKNIKMSETLAHGYLSQSTKRELSNINSNMTELWGFRKRKCVLVLWEKVAFLALEGLREHLETTRGRVHGPGLRVDGS